MECFSIIFKDARLIRTDPYMSVFILCDGINCVQPEVALIGVIIMRMDGYREIFDVPIFPNAKPFAVRTKPYLPLAVHENLIDKIGTEPIFLAELEKLKCPFL